MGIDEKSYILTLETMVELLMISGVEIQKNDDGSASVKGAAKLTQNGEMIYSMSKVMGY